MNFRTLGRTGLKVSEIGFGGRALGASRGPQNDQDSIAALHATIDREVNFIDTAAGLLVRRKVEALRRQS